MLGGVALMVVPVRDRHAILVRMRGLNRRRVLSRVCVMCLWSVFGAAGVVATATLCCNVPVGVMFGVVIGWWPCVGGGGA